MKLFEHVVHLTRGMESGDSKGVIRIEDLVKFLIKIALVKQALNAHFTHEFVGGLDTHSNLLPAS